MVNGVLKQTMIKTTTRLNLMLHTTWSGRRDHLGGDMTPPVDTPSSSGQGARGSSEWSSIPRPFGSVILRKIEEKNQKNMSAQRTSREAQKVSNLLQILKMVEDSFLNRFFVIDIIVSDDDTTMQSVLNNPSIGVRGQVLKSSKGKLNE